MINKDNIIKNEYQSKVPINYRKNPWKTVLFYLVTGLAWILFSDQIINNFAKNQEMNLLLQSIKGSFYVVVTSIMLFYLIRFDYSTIMKLVKSITSKKQRASFVY